MILANKFKRFNKTNEEIIVKSENVEGLSSLLANKVSVVTGKQLSTNDFTNTDKSNVSANTSARHTHSNKSIIDKITQAFIDNWTAAYTHISDTVKHITAAERTKWNGAATSQHTHSNKSILDGITATLVSNWNSAYTHISDAVKHITATERTNWNSAKSKADAALPASSYTAADILKKLLTVDGSGSKLDADLLDGKEATNFASSTHTHTPASIGAANAKHNHSTLDIVRSSNDYWAGNIGSTDRGMINTARSPKSAFLPANCITVEYSSDAGKTWEDYGLSEAQKRGLFALTCDNSVWLSKSSPVSTNDCVRITIEPLDRYVSFDQLYIWFSTGSHACTLDLERSTIGAKDTFSFIRKDVPLGGWSGPNVINFPYGTFGGGVSQTGNNYKYRMTFRTTKLGNSTTQSPTINDIRFYGDNAWAIPNDMVKGDYPFSWDRDMNVNFSKQLKEQGKRVYSDNNKPTPAAIGAATAEQGIKADAALPKSGGTMTGFITLHAAPTANMHPATKKYVDDKMIAAGNGDMTKDVYDPGGRELPYIPKQDVDALAWGGDFGASGTPVSIAYAGANRIAAITAYGENAQGGTTEAPVALTGVENVFVGGRNLLPKATKTQTIYGVTFTPNPDGSVSVSGTCAGGIATYNYADNLIPISPNQVVYLSGASQLVKVVINEKTPSGAFVRNVLVDRGQGISGTLTKQKEENILYATLQVQIGDAPNLTIHPMLNLGESPLPYEPYQGSVTQLPIPRPLHKVGDVRDVCRTRVKSVYDKRVVFAGTENWQWNDSGAWAYITKFLLDNNTGIAPACSHYQGNGAEIPAANQVVINEFASLIIKDPSWKSVADAKAYLAAQKAAGTPVIVYYQSTAYDGTNGLDVCLTEYQTGFVELDGTENWRLESETNCFLLDRCLLNGKFDHNEATVICDRYKSGTYINRTTPCVYAYDYGGTSLGFADNSYDSVDNWKSYLAAQKAAGTPVQIAYQLATPETYATDPVDFDNTAGPLTVMTGGELEVRMTELIGSRSDVSNNTVAFSEAAQDADIQTGEKLTVLFGKIKKRFSVLASTVMMKSVFTQVGNLNLLGNSDFKIWQRGTTFTSPLPSNTYTADRWRNGSGQVTFEKTSNGAKQVGAAVANCELMAQRIEHENGTFDFTFQMKLKSDGPFYLALLSGDGRYQSELFQAKSDFTVCTATFQNVAVTGNMLNVYIKSGLASAIPLTVEVMWAKLEHGTVATPYVPKGYGAELAECLRYYWKSEMPVNIFKTTATPGDYYRSTVYFPVPMRIVPTVTILSKTNNVSINRVTADAVKFEGQGGNDTVDAFEASADL